jgi:hypothetical protein
MLTNPPYEVNLERIVMNQVLYENNNNDIPRLLS